MENSLTVSGHPYTVVDIETTGLFANRYDRIVEIAMLQIDTTGSIRDEYATLVNPERDIGPTHIHGITASDVVNAPRFNDIAGDIAHRLKDSIFVAHNAQFDAGFIEAEFVKLGHPIAPIVTLCTMRLARKFSESLRRFRLADCCSHFHVPHKEEHSSLGDARAVAGLLKAYISHAGDSNSLLGISGIKSSASSHPWPNLSSSGKALSRQEASRHSKKPSYLSRLLDSLPDTDVRCDPNALEYVDLLNRALEDRRITKEEGALFFEIARRWGLSATQVRAIHRDYLKSLVKAAAEDEQITISERRDIDAVAHLLGLEISELDRLIQSTRSNEGNETSQDSPPTQSPQSSLAGLSVCFTGEMRCKINGQLITRPRAEELAAKAGMIVAKSVTKKLDILVVADPETLSTKAAKARKYGTRIMAEAVFWRELNIEVE